MSKHDSLKSASMNIRQRLSHKALGDKVPRRKGRIVAPVFRTIFKSLGWKVVGDIPNVPKAVLLALPHTSNFDGLYAIPFILGYDIVKELINCYKAKENKRTKYRYNADASLYVYA